MLSIIELFLGLSINDFSVPEQKQLQEKIQKIQACKENPNAHPDCKNALERYLETKEKTGEPYVNIQ